MERRDSCHSHVFSSRPIRMKIKLNGTSRTRRVSSLTHDLPTEWIGAVRAERVHAIERPHQQKSVGDTSRDSELRRSRKQTANFKDRWWLSLRFTSAQEPAALSKCSSRRGPIEEVDQIVALMRFRCSFSQATFVFLLLSLLHAP